MELKQQRSSNLELYRIIAMLLIVAHHYVVNSGLTNGVISYQPTAFRSIFMYIFGAWGKTAINCFVMITGYFMCKADISIVKFIKLIFEIIFYKLIFYIIFLVYGYYEFSFHNFVHVIFPVQNIADNFVGCFLIFYLTIPFLNILVKNLNRKQHLYLIILSVFTYTILYQIPEHVVTLNYVIWFAVLFIIASYIRFYHTKIYDNTKIWFLVTIGLLLLATGTILWSIYYSNGQNAYQFVSDSNAIFALLIGISSFIFFKNINIKPNKLINLIGGSTFGVLLIHANSDAMRQWLWKDTLNNVYWFGTQYVFIHAILSVIGIFSICIIIDVIRKRVIEKPVMGYIEEKINPHY